MRRLALPLLLTITGLALAGCAGGSSHPSVARPVTFKSAQTRLSGQFNVVVSQLPDSTPVKVTKQQARDAALGKARATGVTATLVKATNTAYSNVVAGRRKLLISDRTAWLVLIPGQHVPIIYPYGKTGPATYKATMAVLIDAKTGQRLEAAALTS